MGPLLLRLAEVRVWRDLRKLFDVVVCPALDALDVFIGLPLDLPSELYVSCGRVESMLLDRIEGTTPLAQHLLPA